MKKKDLKLIPIGLKADGEAIKKSINVNSFEWQLDKTMEACIGMADAIIQHRKNNVVNEQLAQANAKLFIQVAIMEHLFGKEITQQFIDTDLVAIANRAERILSKKSRKVGFVIAEVI
jgi:hypothetical protein